MTDKGVQVVTFGCRLNAYESQVMRDHAVQAGLDNTIIVNTCAVTAEAERQARQSIRKLRRQNPTAKIVVTGCAAQVHADDFARMDEIDKVIGNAEKMQRQTYTDFANPFIGDTEKVKVNDIMEVRHIATHMVTGFNGHTRAFIQVQNGCNHRCTFCVIPYGRGNSRSVALGEIVTQVQSLVAEGYREVVLTGVDISSYGQDLPGSPTLGQMVRRLLALVPDLPRLRISSIDCIEIDEDLWQVIATEPRLMPHMHLSLQSGDTMILKRMARRHTRQQSIALVERLRAIRPDIAIGADIIVGFPTETEAMFANTVDIIRTCGIVWVHVFPYSARTGTPAARIPNQVPMHIRKQRAKRLRDMSAAIQSAFFQSLLGTVQSVLVEKNNAGHAPNYAPVHIEGKAVPEGTITAVRIVGTNGSGLVGKVVPTAYRQAI